MFHRTLAAVITLSSSAAMAVEGSVEFVNDSPSTLRAVRAGSVFAETLRQGARLSVPESTPISGRFAIAEWAQALDALAPRWAPFHLRTAGVLPELCCDDTPYQALLEPDAAMALTWATGPVARKALAARASWSRPPGPLLEALLRSNPPGTAPPLPPEYRVLVSLDEVLRGALIRHGARALPQLDAAWRTERGLTTDVLGVLRHVAPTPGEGDTATALEALIKSDARLAAGDLAVRLRYTDRVEPRMICGALDLAAGRALKTHHLLAAQAYTEAAAEICGPTLSIRLRAAEFFRARAHFEIAAHELDRAADALRAARLFADTRQDRAQLADCLADLAAAAFADDALERGDRYLAQARATDPLRDKVVAAGAHRPEASPRARAALLIIIIGVAFFTIRRLKRVLSRPPPTPKRRRSRLRGRWRI